MRQQLLNVHFPPAYAYGDWVRHAGAEAAMNRLALWLIHGGRIWLDSEQAAGKTHLLNALQEDHPQLGLVCVDDMRSGHAMQLVSGWLEELKDKALWVLDMKAGSAPAACGLALFHLIERAREAHRPLLISWRCPNDALAPAELSSRLAGFERIQMQPPQNDAELRSVLLSVATSRQWSADEAVVDLLLSRCTRQLDELLNIIQNLEKASLAEGRRLSTAWARKRLGRESELPGFFPDVN